MVKKLFKYEIFSYARTLLPINAILIAISIMGRLVQLFENDTTPYKILFNSTVFAVGVTAAASLLLTFIISIMRFYKNLFGAEGYLTFALPVTPAQHIFVKLITAILFLIVTVCSVLLSLSIFVAGEFLVEILKAAGYLIKTFFVELKGHGVFYLLEFLLLMAATLAFEYLLYYTCIALGQRANKNRILMAGLAYFLFYMAGQVLATVAIILFSILASAGALDEIINWMVFGHPYAAVHIVLCVSTLFYAGLAAAGFFVTHRTVKHKLNLE